ncbi:MAG: 2-oxoacid:acceptor oxidoreductase subunit alpha [Elusimicrobia bacterium]|nr:2-oxoacid:acceptor oxidoreductase subunit alpha [Elusimicrobiota bacterium]
MADTKPKPVETLESVTIRFAGDSGDGIQLSGTQFTTATAMSGNDLSTLPDFPAEIRAPAGTLPGVSSFQIHFSSKDILTPGDEPQVLIAMNPAALKAHVKDVVSGGILILNADTFTPQNLEKAGYKSNPLEDGSLADYRVIPVPLSTLTANTLEDTALKRTHIDRCKNFFALGIMYWLYDRPLEPTLDWIQKKFQKMPEISEANSKALHAGYAFGETTELFQSHYHVGKAPIKPGKYRKITGNEATAFGLIAASQLSGRTLFYGSYPITPASDILHELAKHKNFGVKTFQAEDEIAAVGAAIGASFAGHIGVTGTSGPGVALKSEAIGLAVSTELPLIVLNIQRGGPSTGLPTKTEQADLLQAYGGRNGESPVAILAPATPSDCFDMTIQAVRIALKYMTPVVLLSDGYLANGAEPWKIPDVSSLPPLPRLNASDPDGFFPFKRDPETLARLWALPGTPGLEHRIGGLEKADITGNVSYEPENHERMVHLRAEKIQRIAREIPPTEILGPHQGKLLVVGWGSSYGAIASAAQNMQKQGLEVAAVHVRYLNPFPPDLGRILKNYEQILVPEMNLGQFLLLLRAHYLVPAVGLNKVKGQPFKVSEIENKILQMLGKKETSDGGNKSRAARANA